MSFTNAIEWKKTDTQNNVLPTQNNSINFDSVVKWLKNNSDISISTLWFSLEKIWKTLNDKNAAEVNTIVLKLSKASKYSEIRDYIASIEEIWKKYEAQKNQATNFVWVQEKGFLESIISDVKWFILDSPSLNKIQEIDIDWKVENMDEFNKKLASLIDVVKDDSKFQKLDSESRSKIISWLEKIWTWLERQTNKTLDFLDNKINSLAEQIESQNEWIINLTIQWESITFNSKEEAFEFVQMLKEEAEWEFQSIMTDLAEMVWSTLFFMFSSDLPFKPYIWTKDSIHDWIDSYKDNDPWFYLIIYWLQSLFFIVTSINYTETIYRRIYRDILGKMWIKRYQLWEFSKTRLVFQSWESQKEVERKERYNRRLDAYDYLKNNLFKIEPKNRNAYLKELDSIESYINIDSKTFWLKFEALKEERWLTWRVINTFKYWPKFTPWDIERSQSSFLNTNHNKPLENIKKWLEYAFDWVEVSQLDDWNRTINVWEESKAIKDLRSYIESIEDSNRRKTTIDNLDKFLESLKTEPMSAFNIKWQLYNIIENNYYDKDNIINEINKKYFKNIDVDDLERRWYFKWVLGSYDSFKWKLWEFNKHMVEVWWKYAPTSLTSWQALAIKWREAVKKGEWEWDLEEVKSMFSKIDSGKLKLNTQFPGYNKFFIPVGLFKSIFWKYWIEMPSISNLDRYGSSIKNKAFEDILKKWSEFWEHLKKAKEIFSQELSENLAHVFNLDSDRFPPKQEKLFEKIYQDLKKSVESGEYKLTPDQVKLEFVKMYNWYLTNQRVLLEISNSFSNSEQKTERIQSFIKKVETGKWIWTPDDLEETIKALKSKWLTKEHYDFLNTIKPNEEIKQFLNDISTWNVWEDTLESYKKINELLFSSVKQMVEENEELSKTSTGKNILNLDINEIKKIVIAQSAIDENSDFWQKLLDFSWALNDFVIQNTLLNSKLFLLDIEEEIKKINESWTRLKEIDFANEKFWIFESDGKISLDSYKSNELELVKLLKTLNWDNSSLGKLWALFQTINKDNINYTSTEFFDELNKALWVNFDIDENTTRSDYRWLIISEIEPKLKLIVSGFESKNLEDKKRITEELKNILWVSLSDLNSKTTTSLKNAWFNIWFYTDKIVAFNEEKNHLEAEELRLKAEQRAEKAKLEAEQRKEDRKRKEQQRIEKAKKIDEQRAKKEAELKQIKERKLEQTLNNLSKTEEKISSLNENIKYLENIEMTGDEEEIKELHSDFRKRNIQLTLKVFWKELVFLKSVYKAENTKIINQQISKLKIELGQKENEKLKLETDLFKLEKPKQYFNALLENFMEKLDDKWFDNSVIRDALKNKKAISLINQWEVDEAFSHIEKYMTKKWNTLGLDTSIPKNIWDEIKNRWFTITR